MGLSAQLKNPVLPSFPEVKGGPIIPGHKVVFGKLGYCEFLSLHRNPQSQPVPPVRNTTTYVRSGLVSHCEAPLFGTSLQEALKHFMFSIFLPPPDKSTWS